MGEQLPDIAPIQNRLVREQVCDVIRQAILGGRFSVGQSLPEREIAISLGVSRTPLREALIVLEQEGLVEIRPYRGVVVTGISRRRFSEIMELRKLLEAHAAREAALSMSAEDRAALRALFAELSPRIEAGDISACIELNDRFHAAVARGSGNNELEHLIASYEERENQFLTSLAREPSLSDMLESYREHCAILDALLAGNGDQASELMTHHMSESARRAAHLFP